MKYALQNARKNILQIKGGCITLKEIQQKKEENELFIALLS